ncbi:(Fe-S)-binding protein [Chitinophagales bacterium]|nr:(Fe-S)-binding protein [Chitinophagales bacterium]
MYNGAIDLFVPCSFDQFLPETGWKMVTLLEHFGCKVRYNSDQTCCGYFSSVNGLEDTSKQLADKLLDDFSNKQVVVCPGIDCLEHIRGQLGHFYKGKLHRSKYEKVTNRFFEICSFLVNELKVTKVASEYRGRVYWLDHSNLNLPAEDASSACLSLLKTVRGIELIPAPANQQWSILDPASTLQLTEIVETKAVSWLDELTKKESQRLTVATNNAASFVYLKNLVSRFPFEKEIEVLHPLDLLVNFY